MCLSLLTLFFVNVSNRSEYFDPVFLPPLLAAKSLLQRSVLGLWVGCRVVVVVEGGGGYIMLVEMLVDAIEWFHRSDCERGVPTFDPDSNVLWSKSISEAGLMHGESEMQPKLKKEVTGQPLCGIPCNNE